jgi:hypothetical protein
MVHCQAGNQLGNGLISLFVLLLSIGGFTRSVA